jgi:hypothetical protein
MSAAPDRKSLCRSIVCLLTLVIFAIIEQMFQSVSIVDRSRGIAYGFSDNHIKDKQCQARYLVEFMNLLIALRNSIIPG